jgi:hypothetical protein
MPKNLQGGSKHKKGSNSESSTSKKNKKLFENILTDVRDDDINGVHFGKVVRKLGEGRMEVIFITDERLETVRAPMKGSIRGRGKKDAWVDVGTFVVINETGLTGTMSHEIVMPLSPIQVSLLRKEGVMDERLFEKTNAEGGEGDGIEFETVAEEKKAGEEEEEKPAQEIDIDTI